MRWSAVDIPRQAGKLAIVTGANSGIGYDTALELARAGAEVIIASRSDAKGLAAVNRIQSQYSGAVVRFERLDLASLDSIYDFARRITASTTTLDILINNAGVMGLPRRQTTADGYEMQFGVNFLGHFALTGLLLPILRRTSKPRTVQVSSLAHRSGVIDFDDLQAEKSYKPMQAYNQSKLAMLIFALELQRRADVAHWGLLSTAAHPGLARTEIIANGPGPTGMLALATRVIAPVLMQSSAAGALPTLYAATAPRLRPGGYYGPTGFMEFTGPPGQAKIMPKAQDQRVARRLWEAAEALTGVVFKAAP